MLIEMIELTNFRQYKGKNSIQFSVDPNKNVTVILGENTCGKTTLVQSFIWCLYGHIDFKDKNVLNAEERENLLNGTIGACKIASVLVRLKHNDHSYIIERKETNTVTGNGKIILQQSFQIFEVDIYGNTIPKKSDERHAIINDILPENLSDYFFFWGERIEKLSERKELSGAVKQFLGLDTMNSAIKHLESAVRKLTREAGSGTSNAEIEKNNELVEKLEQSNAGLDEQIKSNENNIAYYKEKAAELYEELTTSESKELMSKQKEFKSKTDQLTTKYKELEKAKETYSKHFNESKNYVYYFANTCEKKAVKLLKENPEPVIGWNYIDMNAVNEILKKGKCICGNEFCDGDDTYKYLIEQRKLVAPNMIGGVINSFVDEAERRDSINQSYYDLVHDDYKRISELQDIILDLEFDVNNLKKNIMGKSDMKEKDKKYQEVLGKIDEYNKRLGESKAEKNSNEEKINRLNNNIIILMDRNAKYKKQVKAINYAQDVLDVFKDDYIKNESILKEKLESYVNENFEEIYSGDRTIKIDENYNAIAYNKVGDKMITSETSPGLETVKNFAFISGLVQCAKEKIIGADGSETAANINSYPLVLDAPFSQTDEKHVPAISKLISKNAEQIILVIMKKDWNYAKEVMNSRVGKSYNLVKITETQTIVKESE